MEEKISDVLIKLKENPSDQPQESSMKFLSSYFNCKDGYKNIEDTLEKWDISNRQLFLGDIDNDGIAVALEALIRLYNYLDKDIPIEDRQPILLYIDSNGGSLTGALTMADAILMSKTPVYTINIGCAYSGGLLVFVTGHKRYCYPSASFLFHEGATSLGDIDAGKFRNFAGFYDQLILKMKQIFLNCTNMTEEFYQEKYRDDYWFFAEEAIEKGFADEVLTELIF